MRRVDPALREAQQGQRRRTARRSAPAPGRRPPRPVEVAEPAADVADLGVGRRAVADVALPQLLARPRRLALGLGERAAPLEHDGPVHAADAREDGERVAAPPSASSPRSTRRRGRSRRPPRRRAIRLQYTLPVEYGPSRPSTAKSIASSRWPMPSASSPWSMRTRPLVCSASASRSAERSAAAELERLRWRAPSARSSSPRAVRGLGLAEQQAAVLDALGVVLERPAGPAQPPAGDGRSGAEGVVLPQPHRALPGPPLVAELVVEAVGALPRRDAVVEPAEPPRGLGQRGRARSASVARVVDGRGRAAASRAACQSCRAMRVADRRQLVAGPRARLTATLHRRPTTPLDAQADGASWAPRCSSTGRISSAGLNSTKTTPSSVQPVWPPGQ